MRPGTPTVSVIVPVRNEATHILDTVASIMRTDYPIDDLEIILADGMSTDGTPDTIREMPSDWPVRLIENPEKNIPAGMNCGIREARGKYVVRMDSHSEYPSNYISLSIQLLEETGASNVGGYLIPRGRSYLGKAIASALSSKFGAGSSFWSSSEARFVTTVAYGAWKTEFLRDIGGFDESWTTNQDFELNARTIENGGSVYFSPEISCIYYCRDSFSALRRQFHNYGRYRAKTLNRYPNTLNLRHLVPTGLVLAFVFLAALAPWTTIPLLALTLLYSMVLAAFAAGASLRTRWSYYPATALALAVIHFSWGIGFIAGIARYGVPRIGIRTLIRTLRTTLGK